MGHSGWWASLLDSCSAGSALSQAALAAQNVTGSLDCPGKPVLCVLEFLGFGRAQGVPTFLGQALGAQG